MKEISVLVLLFSIFSPCVFSHQISENKKILVLFALAPSTPAYISILDGIREKLTSKFGDAYDLHTEYLGLEAYTEIKYPKEYFDVFNKKYKDIDLDLLICVGINLIPTVREYGENFLLDIPNISLDFDFTNFGFKSDLMLNEKTLSIPLQVNVQATIKTAIDLFPNSSSIYIVSGVGPADKIFTSITRNALKNFIINKDTTFINNLSMDELLHKLRSIPSNSIVIVPNFSYDVNGVPYYNTESIRLISNTVNAPVFTYTSTGFGMGSIGGYILDFEKAGLITGESACKILDGIEPNSIKVSGTNYYNYKFDWRQLKRWDLLDSDLFPAESIVMFENISFIERYKWIGGLVFLFILLQSFFIFNLTRLNKKQKNLTKQLIEYQNKYRDFLHMDRSLRIGQLTASLSHELNQPLTAILSTAQAGINFINSNEATPELLKQILQKIVDNDKRTASILSSIRGMLKLESREKEKVNLTNLIYDILEVFKSETILYNIELNSYLPFENVNVLADPIQLEQVILNLLINSSQSLNKISNTKRTIAVSLSKNENVAIVSVEDNGIGIDPEIQSKLFQPFTTSKPEGIGIGLTICKSIIEDHNGKIWADNLPGSGAKFSFSLGIYKDE